MARLRAPSELIARPVASFIVVPPAGRTGYRRGHYGRVSSQCQRTNA